MGESFGAYRIGADDEVFPFITSANVACGFHGGDPTVMRTTLERARALGVAVGAHPGFQDLAGFGRRNMAVTPQQAYDLVVYQIGALLGVARATGMQLQHVKAHGAMYNMAVSDREFARAIATAVRDVDRTLIFFGLPGSQLLSEARALGLATASEAFADRNYLSDGSLVPRSRGDAMIHDAGHAVSRALRMVREGVVRSVDGGDIAIDVDTICIHGDGPNAAEFARRLRAAFEAADIAVRPLSA
jgi:UPF0271 protein